MAELMEVTLQQTYQDQICINRWNYVASGSPSGVTFSFALMSIMGFLPVTTTLTDGTVGGELQSLQNGGVFFNQAIARAVYIDDDFYDSPFLANTNGVGSDGSASMTPINAFGFRSNRVKQSIHRGYKRFVGMGESNVGAGGVIESGTLTQMELLATAMTDTLEYDDEGTTLTFIPCIVQKEKYVVPLSGKDAYRYYEDQAVQLEHTAQGVSWSAYRQTRSQVSRQYGRGS